jgi:hypothetical protein
MELNGDLYKELQFNLQQIQAIYLLWNNSYKIQRI